ncbi:uncharacterized protein LOC131946641 [Physella acuta]|uniref:uncharacterized protein LOC131946641 n=1 Tax=Physella acuta TaxID=109671 RepID=UPI0027DAB6DA|nr:uncharacterized protein LOC131946641 [Physella acuta]XP_059163565.1 uncharacterized protein LOC131946641 [Physella acuta]
MANFVIHLEDVLTMLLTSHLLVLLQLVLIRLLHWCSTFLNLRTLVEIHRSRPSLLPRILTEQLSLWTLMVLTILALTYTSISSLPFSHQPSPYPNCLIRVILSANVARFLVMALQMLLVRETVDGKPETRSVAGQSGKPGVDFVYNLLSAANCLISMAYNENLLLAVTIIIPEISSSAKDTCLVLKLGQKSYSTCKKMIMFSCAICFVSRAFLPITLVTLAMLQETPFFMDSVPLTVFLLHFVYAFLYSCLLLHQSIQRVVNTCRYKPPTSECNTFSINENSNGTNFKENRLVTNQCFSYGFTRVCDNRNLCSPLPVKEKEKLNLLKNKEMAKYFLLYKLPRDQGTPHGTGESSFVTSCRDVSDPVCSRNDSPEMTVDSHSSLCQSRETMISMEDLSLSVDIFKQDETSSQEKRINTGQNE